MANVDGTVTIINSTLSRNRAEDYGFGGGVSNKGGTVTITNSTLSGNAADGGAGRSELQGDRDHHQQHPLRQ